MWTARPLFLLLLLPRPAAAETSSSAAETELLNLRASLGTLSRWQPSGAWTPGGPAPAALLVVHLWAVECPPCVRELPRLRALHAAFQQQLPGVAFAFIAETEDRQRLERFLLDQRERLPRADIYRSEDKQLRASVPCTEQPLTLILDEKRVVRQAFIGSLLGRRSELVTAIERVRLGQR